MIELLRAPEWWAVCIAVFSGWIAWRADRRSRRVELAQIGPILVLGKMSATPRDDFGELKISSVQNLGPGIGRNVVLLLKAHTKTAQQNVGGSDIYPMLAPNETADIEPWCWIPKPSSRPGQFSHRAVRATVMCWDVAGRYRFRFVEEILVTTVAAPPGQMPLEVRRGVAHPPIVEAVRFLKFVGPFRRMPGIRRLLPPSL